MAHAIKTFVSKLKSFLRTYRELPRKVDALERETRELKILHQQLQKLESRIGLTVQSPK